MKNIILILTLFLFACTSNEQNKIETSKPIITKDTVHRSTIENNTFQKEDSLIIKYSDLLAEHHKFNGYVLNTASDSYHIKGDFYGDMTEDIALLIKDSTGTKIGIIDYGTDLTINIIGIGEDSLGGTDYSWIGIFSTVPKGDVLWSNYEDDWRDLDDIPENEKIILNYNAVYTHAAESCGGGFIFWKDNKWNWLQQE